MRSAALSGSSKDEAQFLDKKPHKELKDSFKQSIRSIRAGIKSLEQKIKEVLDSDEQLQRLFNLASSVQEVGLVTAAYFISATNEFKNIATPKQFACYTGVAPFGYSSGSSIRRRNKVSPLVNKQCKTLLHLSAMVATRYPGELKTYYERKVREGKNKMLVLNAVRNKIIHRVFAAVKRGEPYQQEYAYTPPAKSSIVA